MKYALFLFPLLLLAFSCHDRGVEPPRPTLIKWQALPSLSSIDVRYIVELAKNLYLAGIDTRKQQGEVGYGIVYFTFDGEKWQVAKEFKRAVGPLATRGDSLYLLSDSLYRMNPNQTWEAVCDPQPLTQDPSAIGDIVFFRDTLYAMQSLFSNAAATYRIDFDGTVTQIPVRNGSTYGGSKFMKVMENGQPVLYVRGQYYLSGFYRFDGNTFTPLANGLSSSEFNLPPTNSLGTRNDTLFAGFRFPASIKFLRNDRWFTHTDTMPYTKMYDRLPFKVKTEPTAIAFAGTRLFVATTPIGVIEWTGREWKRSSDGLPVPPINGTEDLYNPVVHLLFFQNKLLAGYGKPGFAPWGGTGLYVLSIPE